MKALTLKEIFKAVELNNKVSDITLNANQNICIYVDDEPVFCGQSYAKYVREIKKVYFEPFAEAYLKNPSFAYNKTKFWDWDGREHEIEFFIYTK